MTAVMDPDSKAPPRPAGGWNLRRWLLVLFLLAVAVLVVLLVIAEGASIDSYVYPIR